MTVFSEGVQVDILGVRGLTACQVTSRIPALPALSSSPRARARGKHKISYKFGEEGGRIELRRADTRLTAYKAASTPNGLHLPHQKPMRFEGIGRQRLESGARIELAVAGCRPAALPLGYPDSGLSDAY